MISYGIELLGAHLRKEIINELIGVVRLIYLKKSLISYAHGLLGLPRLIYLKKSYISYANDLVGIPKLMHLKKMLSVCGRGEAHSLKESCDFLCRGAPGIPRSSFTSRSF
jgi:hypothetical protein